MPVYVVAQGRSENRKRLNEYVAKALPTIQAGGGRVVAFDPAASNRIHARHPDLLVAAWAVLAGGLYNSFFGQLERGAANDVSGLATATVLVIKGALYAVTLTSLVLSVRAAIASKGAAPERGRG